MGTDYAVWYWILPVLSPVSSLRRVLYCTVMTFTCFSVQFVFLQGTVKAFLNYFVVFF